MLYDEEDLIPLSYLSQFYYCRRRAGLLLLEELWSGNEYTAEGTVMHENVHQAFHEYRADAIKYGNVFLVSYKLGLSGKSDLLELLPEESGFTIPRVNRNVIPVPVEYKHGELREENEYFIQLCGQAMCLEEMWNCTIHNGFVFFGSSHRRKEVIFSPELRSLVEEGAAQLREMLTCGVTPPAEKSPKCNGCSMINDCMPDLKRDARAYRKKYLDPNKWEEA